VDTVHLTFNLNEDVTHVTSKLALKPNYAENGAAPPLFMHGRDDVKLVGLKVAGAAGGNTCRVAGRVQQRVLRTCSCRCST
jgi:hypothetical protein